MKAEGRVSEEKGEEYWFSLGSTEIHGLDMDLSARNVPSKPGFGRYFLPDLKKNIQLLDISP